MTATPLRAPPRPRRCRTALKAWTVLVLVLGALGGFAFGVEWDQRRELAGWNGLREQLYDLRFRIGTAGYPRFDQISSRFSPAGPPATQMLSEGTTFRAVFDGKTFGPEFDGWTVSMTFLNNPTHRDRSTALTPDGLAHGRLLYITARPPRMYRSSPTVLWHHVQTGRRSTFAVGAITWVGAAVLVFVAGPWRRSVAQVCVATAVTAAAAWLLAPRYDWTRLADDLVLRLIGAGLLFGVLFVLLPARPGRRRFDLSRCRACKYDLTGNESGVCPECGTVTLAFIEGQRHAESARLAAPLESEPLVYGPQPEAFVVLDDTPADADEDREADGPESEFIEDVEEEPAITFRTASSGLSAAGSP